jgi:hypothetical protein
MGVAVLEGDELVDWRVSCFREPVGDVLLDAVERRVRGLIHRFEPEVVAIEEPSHVRLQMSPALPGIVARIRAVATGAILRFVAISPEEVRKQMCGEEKATHAEMAGKLVEWFEHLERYRRDSGQLQEDYWRPMFSAVGVGVTIGITDKIGLANHR